MTRELSLDNDDAAGTASLQSAATAVQIPTLDSSSSDGGRRGETEPLLPVPTTPTRRKKWYRARPLWLVPLAFGASLSRGMTLAPRIQIFTDIACEHVWANEHVNHTALHASPSFVPLPPPAFTRLETEEGIEMTGGIPPMACVKDPKVQAGAAKLQTAMTTSTGLLSALSTGWWGRFGQQHGRLKVFFISMSGLLLTDLTYLLLTTQRTSLTPLLLAPLLEGLSGGYPTLQSTTAAYIADCTSSGSRSRIFARFMGVFFVGIAVGPGLGVLVGKTLGGMGGVFRGSMSVYALCLVLCIITPESLSAARRAAILAEQQQPTRPKRRVWNPLALFRPLGVFLPRKREYRKGLDWNFPLVAGALSCYLLTTGMYPSKHLYASHTYEWGAEQLGYYITMIGTSRALVLLIILPYVIRTFKPTPPPPPPQPTQTSAPSSSTKPSDPDPLTLAHETSFDLSLARISLMLDVLSHTLVLLLPSSQSFQSLFIASSLMTSLGGGALPSLQSLAICISQIHGDLGGVGELMGAVSFLQACGMMVGGPLLFGTLYATTVATYPKAIFLLAATLLCGAVTFLAFVRPNRRLDAILQERDERGRGRDRRRKGLSII